MTCAPPELPLSLLLPRPPCTAPLLAHDRIIGLGPCSTLAAVRLVCASHPAAGDIQRLNNCYCYAVNQPSKDWCDPGAANGAGILSPSQLSCEALTAAVVADGGQTATRAQVRGAAGPGGWPATPGSA